MKVKKINKYYNPKPTTHIFISNFNRKNYKKLKQLLKKLNFTKDKQTQKKLNQLAYYGLNKLYKERGYRKFQIKIKIIQHKISKQISQQTKNKIIDGKFKTQKGHFNYSFQSRRKQLFANVQSDNFTGEEFLSLIFSNC